MAILDLFQKRRSIRAFSNRKITESDLLSLFDAARWAPSSYNEQPWFYLYTTKDYPEAFEKFLSCLTEANQKWAKDAFALMISLGKIINEQTNAENKYFMHDVGAANAYLCLQATHLGFQAHQMAGFDKNKVIELFGIDSSKYFPITMIAVGYPANLEELPENIRKAETSPRKRKEINQFTQKIEK